MIRELALMGMLSSAALGLLGGESTRTLNVNGSMELGREGLPVPGWTLEVWRFNREEAKAKPNLMVTTVAAPGGVTGQCLQVPVVKGLVNYSLVYGELNIDRDGEVEISFDYKRGPVEGGAPSNLKCGVDFRCLGDEAPAAPPVKPDHPRYPVLKGFSVAPTAEWQHVARTFKVIKWRNVYIVRLNVWNDAGATLNAPLLLDNFSVKMLGDKPEPAKEEAVAVTEKPDADHFGGDTVKMTVRALLNSRADAETLTVRLLSDLDGAVWKEIPVPVARLGQPDARGLYEGELSFAADKFGSYHVPLRAHFREAEAGVEKPRHAT